MDHREASPPTPLLQWHALLAALLLAGCAVERAEREEPAPETPPPEKAPAPFTQAPAEPEPRAPAPEPRRTNDLKPYIVRARASSTQGDEYAAEQAFDGKAYTRWSSAYRDGEWIEAFFDRRVAINSVTIHWETARATDFGVELLNSRSNWVAVGERAGAAGPTDRIDFERPLPALGVRIACVRRATEWGNSIYEVDMTGTTEGEPPAQNLLTFKPRLTPWPERERAITERLLAEAAADPPTSAGMADDAFLDLVERRSFDYFWCETNPTNGLTKDRGRNFASSEDAHVASVAAVGFALTACAIGAERGWVPRAEALERVRITLRTFYDGPVRHVRGFFPHFVNIFTGRDAMNTEISTIDTALFLAGMITAMEYFQDPEVSRLSRNIFQRVDWGWARGGHPDLVTHGVDANGNLIGNVWGSVTEGLLIYLVALGSPAHALPASSWYAIDRHAGEYAGYAFVGENGFQSIFRFQYPALWYDFRGRTDKSGVDYFENATLATLAMRQYCIDLAPRFPGSYGPDLWGLGAADGPGDRYMIYGFPPGEPYSPTDGTVVPYAIAGSICFLPQHSLRALRNLYDRHHEAWGKYGFADSVNPSLGFVARDALGLDAGTIMIAIENYRSGFVWDLFMRNPWIRAATSAIAWRTRPTAADPGGPVDLARDHTWRFQTGGGILAAPELDDRHWREVVVPDRWENLGGELAGYDGMAWYRVAFDLGPDRLAAWTRAGRPIVLALGAVDDADAAYVNGYPVGETRTGDDLYRKPRRYVVPASYLSAGRNVAAVRVTDYGGSGGIWRPPVRIGPE